MLHTPRYDVKGRSFCGPTAMSAITGLSISIIRDTIRDVRGNVRKSNGNAWPVMGLATNHLVEAMDKLGWRVVDKMHHPKAHEFKGWLKPYRLREFLDYVQMNEGAFIVVAGNHYIAASETEVCDTFTKLPIPIVKWKRQLGRHVTDWWKFEN